MTVTEIPHGTGSPAPSPRRLMLVSVPRTASNLLVKILNIPNQANVRANAKGGYFFHGAFLAATRDGYLNKAPQDWTDEDKTTVKNLFQECIDTLEEYSAQAQKENKTMFAKEHAFWLFNLASLYKSTTGLYDEELFKALRLDIPEMYGPTRTYSPSNETMFSDEYLRSWQLAFIIRHPALAWPSMYRALQKVAASGLMDEDCIKGASLTNMSMRWTRMLYDWCLEQPDVPTPPPVVDAHDLIHNPQVVLKLCEQTGLDPSVVRFEWGGKDEAKESDSWDSPRADAGTEEHGLYSKAAAIMLSTLEASKGIEKTKAPESIDISVEAETWKVEFGEEIGQLIEKAVWDSMPDYEYLKAHRLTV